MVRENPPLSTFHAAAGRARGSDPTISVRGGVIIKALRLIHNPRLPMSKWTPTLRCRAVFSAVGRSGTRNFRRVGH